MGCGSSKIDDLPLVTLCRERKQLIKEASNHRYALAAAHVAYFQSLKDVGEAIKKFVEEELVISSAASASTSAPDSPVLRLPSEGKGKSKTSSSDEISAPHSINSKHLSFSDSDSDLDSSHSDDDHDHDHHHDDVDDNVQRWSDTNEQGGVGGGGFGYYSQPDPQSNWGFNNGYDYPPYNASSNNSNMYFMKKSATPSNTYFYQHPDTYRADSGPANNSYPSGYSGGFFGFPAMESYGYGQARQEVEPPPPPGPPEESTMDYLFSGLDAGYYNDGNFYYPGYYQYQSTSRYSNNSSPDSMEVREREGIPDLEDETENEVLKRESLVRKSKKKKKKKIDGESEMQHHHGRRAAGEGTSTSKSVHFRSNNSSEESKPSVASQKSGGDSFESLGKGKGIRTSVSSPDSVVSSSISSVEESVKKKEVSFDTAEVRTVDVETPKPSGLRTMLVHGTRDLREVVDEIKDEFETASSFGKEVATMLEVGRLPYLRRSTPLKVIYSRIMHLIAPSMVSTQDLLEPSVKISSRTIKLAEAYSEEPGKDFNTISGNLSLTLQKLYAWEKKLYKEVKDEEKLRVTYEKECKKLRTLGEQGAESSKIEAVQASTKRLMTKLDICFRAIDAISSRIHKLRDEELQPQLNDLILGLTRMWKSMLKCHQKQFQALMESKVRSLKANTGFQRDSGVKATVKLEMELLNWCDHFNDWINNQKYYSQSLNEWLSRCLLRESEVTDDGVAPFSPGRIGAPPIFIICNDWYQSMARISDTSVGNAMRGFASSLHKLWERQDEEQKQRIKAEYLTKDFENQLRTLRMQKGRKEVEQDAASEKTAVSRVTSESGVSPLDDLKVDLDSMRNKLEEERIRHKEAIKLVNSAASSSLQGGLIPIFEALGNFTSEVLKAHEQVRLQTEKAL